MKKILLVDIDGVIADYDKIAAQYPDKEERHKKGFFLSLPIIDGALEAVKKLSKHYDVYFCSTAPWTNINAGSEKRIWIEHYFGELAFKRLILTHRKDLIVGDYLIDDRTKNGAGEFKGKHIHFGSLEFPDWEAVLAFLIPEDSNL